MQAQAVRILNACLLAVMLLPAVAFAQPRGAAPAPAAPALSPEQVQALVDDAVAKALAAAEAKAAEEATSTAAADAEAKRQAEADLTARVEAKTVEVLKAALEGHKAETKEASHLRGENGFMDVRLNFTLTNENLLAKPGETIPSVPGWRFGRPNSLGTLFFDNYDTRFSGYETLSHAVMYRNYSKDKLEVDAAFVLRINELTERRIDFSDAGSYIAVSWYKDPTRKDPTRLSLTAFPISADRFRLGYSYRLSWGGSEEYRRSSQAVPGVKLQYDTKDAYAFIGAKSAVVLDSATAEQVSVLGFLGGAGYDVSDMIRVEVNGGYFNRGSNELEDVNTEDVELFGGSVQISAHDGMPVSSSIDYKLYKNDSERVGRLFQKTKYKPGLSWLAMGEATLLGQTLKDPEASGSTKIQWGRAGDVNIRVMQDRIRFRADLQYRDLAYILHSVPSLPTYSDFPVAYDITPNYFAALGVDKNWNDKYTAGIVLGIEMPATLTSPTGIPGDTAATGESTAVIRNSGGQTLITILPAGKSAVPQFAGKLSGQIDFGDVFSTLLDVYFSHDPNQTRLARDDAESTFRYEFGEFNQLGVNLTLQAKF
ncbi:MAG: hypothetical protein IPL79_07465 [Myxococcales bacterium]|nr:hypothetical protein [Myxococcales bacterium]